MPKYLQGLTDIALWIRIATAAFIIFILTMIYLIFRPVSTPAGALDAYISSLARHRCAKAYTFVSYFEKKNDPRYATFEDFQRSVCIPVVHKYTYLDMIHVDDTIINGDTANLLVRLKYRASWMPMAQIRTVTYLMRKEGSRWRVDGPDLQP